MAEPADIDARDREDLVDIGDAGRGLDERDDEGPVVLRASWRDDVAAAVVVMGKAETDAALALRPIAAPGGKLLGLGARSPASAP